MLAMAAAYRAVGRMMSGVWLGG